ncbi:hypothetical protein ETAF_1137 [Edwardsiella tarda FL6-60]|uniref:Uncharacterized protein n=1 Tax=Edwardsiella tarda (strain FL6-60) TaxID=718251 RepID=A0A0H3DTH2_EDWTF|nr:hypothetical protein ETAF_1137 [Edwardsiella tarda FL6-60]
MVFSRSINGRRQAMACVRRMRLYSGTEQRIGAADSVETRPSLPAQRKSKGDK